MLLGPLLMLTGALLRARFHFFLPDFFLPDQLAAYERHPTLRATAYGLFAAGNLLLWPAVAVVAARIGARSAGWGLWGGVLVMSGLFARAFHAGVDHLAFQLVRSQGVEPATEAVSAGYGAFRVFATPNIAILAGWIVLALGAWRTRVERPGRQPLLRRGTVRGVHLAAPDPAQHPADRQGVGITPVRAPLEEATGHVVVLYRARSEADAAPAHRQNRRGRHPNVRSGQPAPTGPRHHRTPRVRLWPARHDRGRGARHG
ncbi:hypothetical protein ACGF5O_21670 [Streptomyces sp. NPDC048291]|uniref:hypothetical protein n=1 Tax=Streptomyces sp. NPDC048291 TaxID=3365530 RepID=UPI003711C306